MTIAPACIRRTNDPGNHTEYDVPSVAGPSPFDDQGRLNTWTAVIKQAGVVSHFPDDSEDARVRSGVTPRAPPFSRSHGMPQARMGSAPLNSCKR